MSLKIVTDPVAKALWYIENNFAGLITLDAIAQASGVSRFYIARAFGEATSCSVMQYVRGRRLTEAARALCAGATDILAVALQFGYGSHEAFTRAFHAHFGVTPDAVRTQRRIESLSLVDAIRRDRPMVLNMQEPRVQQGQPLFIAGLTDRYSYETVQRIPLQWQNFAPHIGHIPGQVGYCTYGVRLNSDNTGFEYLAGVEVANLHDIPVGLQGLRIPEQTYAVFSHEGHISMIRGTMDAIYNTWLPASTLSLVDAPSFERYGEGFDPKTGSGTVEIWIPVEKSAS